VIAIDRSQRRQVPERIEVDDAFQAPWPSLSEIHPPVSVSEARCMPGCRRRGAACHPRPGNEACGERRVLNDTTRLAGPSQIPRRGASAADTVTMT